MENKRNSAAYKISDKDFTEKHNDDLNIVLLVATLFSAVTTAFITFFQPKLETDSGDDTSALLRVLIYKTDNTTFGGVAPAIPQWKGAKSSTFAAILLTYLALAMQLVTVVFAIIAKQVLYLFVFKKGENSDTHRSVVTYLVMMLPLLLQFSLLIMAAGVTTFLLSVDKRMAGFMFGFLGLFALLCIAFLYLGITTILHLGRRHEEVGQGAQGERVD